jgi:hypothetical protein
MRASASSAGICRPFAVSREQNASHSVGSSSRRSRRSRSIRRLAEVREEAPVFEARQELHLAELHRLEAARRRQVRAKLQEVLR